MRYTIGRAVLLLATLIGLAPPALAKTDECAPSMDPAKFSDLVSTSGTARLHNPAEGYLPLETTITMRFPGGNESMHFKACVMPTDAIASVQSSESDTKTALPPLSYLPVKLVVKDGQNTDVQISLVFPKGGAIKSPMFSDRFTIPVVGCLTDATGMGHINQ